MIYITERYRIFELFGEDIEYSYTDIIAIKKIIKYFGAEFIIENNNILFKVNELQSPYDIVDAIINFFNSKKGNDDD
jgi:hypothetical protein